MIGNKGIKCWCWRRAALKWCVERLLRSSFCIDEQHHYNCFLLQEVLLRFEAFKQLVPLRAVTRKNHRNWLLVQHLIMKCLKVVMFDPSNCSSILSVACYHASPCAALAISPSIGILSADCKTNYDAPFILLHSAKVTLLFCSRTESCTHWRYLFPWVMSCKCKRKYFV